jgi:hypothetical protein
MSADTAPCCSFFFFALLFLTFGTALVIKLTTSSSKFSVCTHSAWKQSCTSFGVAASPDLAKTRNNFRGAVGSLNTAFKWYKTAQEVHVVRE